MKLKTVSLGLQEAQLETLSENGWRVRGFATRFGNINSHGFKIQKGAYSKLIEAGVKPKMFFNHDAFSVPIGQWETLEETASGLRVEGTLTQGVALAADVYAALKAGTVDGLSVSIGWDDAGMSFDEKGVMSVTEISLLDEISIVTWPSDSRARVTQTLSVDELDDAIEAISTVRELEAFFKKTGLSKRQSGWLLAKAKAAFAADSAREVPPEDVRRLAAIMDRIKADLN